KLQFSASSSIIIIEDYYLQTFLHSLNREIRRREKVIQIFPNTESIIRLIGAVLQDDHNEWSVGHKIFDMKEYYDKLSSIQSNLLKIKVA
ncbi:transposase, partial [Agathobacter rectalis]|uniref:transposase n=1 Tax=Agathobacter rectalis TaxID=39491 RepID=UPI0027D32481